MLDGMYAVQAKTPLGTRKGTIVLTTQDPTCLFADLTVAGKTKRLVGTLDGDLVTFAGGVKLPFPFGELKYSLSGTVTGDDLVGVCKTKRFSFDVLGTRMA